MSEIPVIEPTGPRSKPKLKPELTPELTVGSKRFTRQSRLLKPSDFKRVFQQPFRSSDHCFRILSRFNDTQRHRLGMAVSKKSCPKAVGRNRIKRIVRENFRLRLAGLETVQALDFVILPTTQAAGLSNQVLDESLNKQWRRLIQKAAQASSVKAARTTHEE